MESNIQLAFLLTLLAWLSTGIGSFLIFFTKKFNPKLLSGSLGFSAWVMIYVSFMEILPKSLESLSQALWEDKWYLYMTIAFFLWIAIIAVIDKMVPSYENPHEIKNIKTLTDKKVLNEKKLLRMWLFSALAISLHNFPEWLATFAAAIYDPSLWISIAVAIAIHNIPEWIAVAAPIYFATKSKIKAASLWFLSGFAEVIWALIWYFFLLHLFWDLSFWFIFALVAWIMIYISLDELLPTAEEYWEHHIAIWWLIIWMLVMAASLVLI